MSKLKSEGKCIYCEKMVEKINFTRHLNIHLKKKENASGKKYFHIKVDANEMFLHLLVSHKADMADIDDFLREIWLECCGHLSAFSYKNQAGYHEIEMDENVGESIQVGKEYQYDYDFGSTTRLKIKVLKEFVLKEKKNVILLTRNEPLELYCHSCEKAVAENICTMYHASGYMFCEDCSDDHEEECEDAEYALMPIVNSPRMGVCGYDGGSIDTERDGIYQLKK